MIYYGFDKLIKKKTKNKKKQINTGKFRLPYKNYTGKYDLLYEFSYELMDLSN